VYKIDPLISLGVIVGILTVAIIASLIKRPRTEVIEVDHRPAPAPVEHP
jgi:hypothetical protein